VLWHGQGHRPWLLDPEYKSGAGNIYSSVPAVRSQQHFCNWSRSLPRDKCSRYRTITWGETPVADAGPDLSRCSVTPLVPIAMTNASASGTYSSLIWSGVPDSAHGHRMQILPLQHFTPTTNFGSFVATPDAHRDRRMCRYKFSDTRLIEWSYAATVNAGPDQGICAVASATLAGSIGGSATSATWSGGTGTFAPNNTTLNASIYPECCREGSTNRYPYSYNQRSARRMQCGNRPSHNID